MSVLTNQAESIRNCFGYTGVFTPANGSPVSLKCELDEIEGFQPDGYQGQVWTTTKTIEILSADVLAEPNIDDVFVVDSVTYKVKRVISKDNWFVKLAVK